MVVGAPRNQAETLGGQRLGQRLGVGHDAGRIVGEAGIGGLSKRHGLGGDHVLERATLQAGEDGLVDRLGVLLATQDGAAPRAAQRLVRGEGDDVGFGHRVGMHAAGDQPCDMSRVEHEQRAHLIGDLPEDLGIDLAWIGGRPGHDHLWLVFMGQGPNRLIVDALV